MDEQECILEIVDGVIKLVPKDKSHLSSPNTDDDKSDAKQKSLIEYETSNNYGKEVEKKGRGHLLNKKMYVNRCRRKFK